jgi:hypothetical protein
MLGKIKKSALISYGLKREKEGIPLVKWSKLAKPKESEGWGLKNIHFFGQALAAKSL